MLSFKKRLPLTGLIIGLPCSLLAQSDSSSSSDPANIPGGYQPDAANQPNAQEALTQRGEDLGRAQILREQRQQNQLALIKAQAEAAAEAQMKVDQERAETQFKAAYEQSVDRAVAEYPTSNDSDSALGKAITKRFADMPDNDPLWQNPDRPEIVAREEAAKLGIKGTSEAAAQSTDDQKGPQATMGTGFFVTDDGYILTDFHVVTGAHLIEIKDGKGVHPATLVAHDPANDLAVLKVDETDHCLPLGDSGKVTLGQSVFTVGFPNPDVQGLNPKLTKGEVSSLSGLQDDPRMYQISAPVQPGNSGGCLVDETGNVVGIISSKLNAVAMANATGDVPQNVNYALKISYAKLLLDTVTTGKDGLAVPSLAPVPFDKDVAAVEDSTVMVIAQ